MIKILFFNEKAQQLKELEASFVAATKEMQSAQAKMAVETAKEVFPSLYVDLELLRGCIFFPKIEFFINHYLEHRVFYK